MRGSKLELAVGISLFALAWALWGWGWYLHEEPESTCDEKLTHEQVREAVWEALHPCNGGPMYGRSEKFPTKEWCDEQRRKAFERREAEEARPDLYTMHTCVTEGGSPHDNEVDQHIDTVDDPRIHYSWVLGGGCEALAHEVNQKYGLCADYVDDEPVSAEKCRLEIKDWLETYCKQPNLDDRARRDCLRR